MASHPFHDVTPPSTKKADIMSTAGLCGIERFLLVRSMTTDDASVRLQSEPIRKGLLAAGADVVLHACDTALPLVVDRPTCILFHYADQAAIDVIRHRSPSTERLVVVCLACDVYSYSPYIKLHSIVDFFIAPTELHRTILSSQLFKPVYTLPECIDPIALGKFAPGLRGKPGRRLLWFGYSESFFKGMTSLMPILLDHQRRGTITSITLIVDRKNFLAKYGAVSGLELIDYHSSDFLLQAQAFDYSILSHFALDLAVNSYIKSPNKLLTSLIAGLIPLCSDTPNYRAVLDEYGLSRFLFSSPGDLNRLLTHLDPDYDGVTIRQSGATEGLLDRYSVIRICRLFLDILDEHLCRNRESYELFKPELPPPESLPILRLKEHLRDLLPSAIRTVRERSDRKQSR